MLELFGLFDIFGAGEGATNKIITEDDVLLVTEDGVQLITEDNT